MQPLKERFAHAPQGPEIDYYENAEGWKPTATCTLADLIDGIRGDTFAAKVAAVRAHIAEGDKAAADALKKTLPAVSLSGCITGRRKAAVADGRFEHSGLLQIDLDAKDNVGWSLEEMREILQADPRMVAVFVTPSGQGIKGVARIPQDASTHKAAFLAAEAHFRTLNLQIDPSCKDPVRLCFVSHDPAAWLRMDTDAQFEPVVLEVVEELEDDEEDDDAKDHRPETKREPTFRISDSGGLVIRGSREFDREELTLTDLAAMIAKIPRPKYDEWLHICSGAWNHFGEAATAVLAARWPEESPGEYGEKFAKRTADHSIGTVWHFAEEAGWKPDKRLREIKKEQTIGQKIANLTQPPTAAATEKQQSFRPEDIFYDAPNGKFLVRVGRSFFVHGRKSPVVTGLIRHFAPNFRKPSEVQAAAVDAISARELDGAVQWTGTIAGHKQGLATDANGMPILITSEANPPQPIEGDAPLITEIVSGAFADDTALLIFMSWLAGRYQCVKANTHVASPMMVLAGEVNSGKSLLAWLIAQVLGGRTANPYAAWSGGILWNDDLVGSELLLVDDCIGSTDIRSRRNFGASFKEAIYPHAVQLRKRNSSSVTVRPVWCVLVCCNDTPESLQIIPPLDADLSDKVALLHVIGVTLPIDTSTPEGKLELQRRIREELPAFAHQLMNWQTPPELKDSRSGVKAWRDPELAEAVEAHSPAKRLESLLEAALTHHGVWHDLPRDLTASEIEARLLDHQSPVRDQARTLFSWHGACGSALAKLGRGGSEYVAQSDRQPGGNRAMRYYVSR